MLSKVKNYILSALAAVISILLAVIAYLAKARASAQTKAREAEEEADVQAIAVKAQSNKIGKAISAQNKAQHEAAKAQESVSSGRRNYFENTKL